MTYTDRLQDLAERMAALDHEENRRKHSDAPQKPWGEFDNTYHKKLRIAHFTPLAALAIAEMKEMAYESFRQGWLDGHRPGGMNAQDFLTDNGLIPTP